MTSPTVDTNNFPSLPTPIADQQGNVTPAWRYFFINLWQRTGGAVPNTISIPSGTIYPFAGSALPAGFLFCDGTQYSQTAYANLYAAIGNIWGAASAGNFRVPDLRDRTLFGAGNLYTLGQLGGHASLTIAKANLPSYNLTVTDPGHIHTVTDPGHHHSGGSTPTTTNTAGAAAGTSSAANTGNSATGITVDSAVTGISVASGGNGVPAAIIPPFAGVYYIIKT